METGWLKDYVQLALRVEKIFRARAYAIPFLGYYYGPMEWRQQVDDESVVEPLELLCGVNVLQETVEGQGFDAHRVKYLGKQLRAIEMVCRKLCGEQFTVAEELLRLYDIELTWVPEEQFERALALYDEALPVGSGSIEERLGAWGHHSAIPEDKQALVSGIVEQWVEEDTEAE